MFNPSNKLVVDCYADIDFSVLWGHANPKEPICDRIRTVFVVTFVNCPLFWLSKIQTYIALYNLHSEYVELSNSVRDLPPLKSLIKKVIENLGIDSEKLKFVSSSIVCKDNNGAIIVSTSPRMSPTSNHIAVRYHWFRHHIEK